jgi:hypothetical protein
LVLASASNLAPGLPEPLTGGRARIRSIGERVTRTLSVDEARIKSLEDARRYREELSARKPEDDPGVANWMVCKRCVLAIIVAAFVLMYYLISVNVEVLSLPQLNVAVKIST